MVRGRSLFERSRRRRTPLRRPDSLRSVVRRLLSTGGTEWVAPWTVSFVALYTTRRWTSTLWDHRLPTVTVCWWSSERDAGLCQSVSELSVAVGVGENIAVNVGIDVPPGTLDKQPAVRSRSVSAPAVGGVDWETM